MYIDNQYHYIVYQKLSIILAKNRILFKNLQIFIKFYNFYK